MSSPNLHLTRFNHIILAALLVSLIVLAGCRSGQKQPSIGNSNQQRILYLAPDERKKTQIFVIPLDDGEATQLTREADGVWDYDISPDGTIIAYTALNADEGGDLWAIAADGSYRQRLLDCGDAACSEPAWFAGGQSLVYTRQDASQLPRLWQLDPSSGDTSPFFDDSQMSGYGAHFSPVCRRLSYFSPADEAIRIYNLETGASSIAFSQMREAAVWSAQGDALYSVDVGIVGERYTVHLLRIDLETGEIANISGDREVDDAWPAPSPDGQWIAFGRKAPRVAMGRQLWLMHPDGSESHYLTDDSNIHHAPLSWSPDGRYLLFQRAVLAEPEAQPALWIYERESGDIREVASLGRQATWLVLSSGGED